jgi:glyoxylate reductase
LATQGNAKPKVFVTRPLPVAALQALAEAYALEVRPQDAPMPAEELAAACRDAVGLLAAGVRVTEEVLKQAEHLRAISNTGVGYDNIDVAACTARGIPVANTPGVVEEATADLTFALLLGLARRVAEADNFIRQGRWQEWRWTMLAGADVHHKTLGIYGFGRIGQAVGRRARGFSMRILYYQRHRAPEALERELAASFVDRQTLLREADFLSLHVPLTRETHHALGARELELMKPTAFLINTSRGKVVDEGALVEALEQGRIAGAALDVFEHEPHLHPALSGKLPTLLTPHIGTSTAETRFRMAQRAAENLAALLEGRRPAHVVNPEVFGR